MSKAGKHPLSHAGVYLLARGGPGLITFLAIPLFTRLLTPADYGRYALLIASVNLLNALLFQWLRLALVRYLPIYRDRPGVLKSTMLMASLALAGLLAVAAAAIYIGWLGHGFGVLIFVCWMLLVVQSLFELSCEYARATIKPWLYMWMQMARATIWLVMGVTLIRLGAAWLGPAIGSAIATGAVVIFAALHDWRDVRPKMDRETLSQIAHYGIPISITVALSVVIWSSDRFLIAWFLGEGAAGLYSVAVDFTAQTLTLMMLAISMAMFPLAVRAWEHEGLAAAQDRMRANGAMLLAIGVPCVVGLEILAPAICKCFLGAQFQAAAVRIMPVIAIGAFLAGMKAYHFDASFQFAKRTIHQVWIAMIAAAFNVIVNVLCIPRWGIAGAASASVSAFVISIAMTIYFGRRHFPMPFPWRASVQVAIATALMACVILPFRDSLTRSALALEIVAGAAVYGIALFGMNFMDLRSSKIEALPPGAVDIGGVDPIAAQADFSEISSSGTI